LFTLLGEREGRGEMIEGRVEEERGGKVEGMDGWEIGMHKK